MKAAVFFVGNRLMLDEGLGPAVYDELIESYEIPDNVELFDVGCMALNMVRYVDECDFVLSVDAVDGTGEPPGTIVRFRPDDMARGGMRTSLHDLKLADLFDAAMLLGYEADGLCLGMQVKDMDPPAFQIGLTEPVRTSLPGLTHLVVEELARRGYLLSPKPKDE